MWFPSTSRLNSPTSQHLLLGEELQQLHLCGPLLDFAVFAHLLCAGDPGTRPSTTGGLTIAHQYRLHGRNFMNSNPSAVFPLTWKFTAVNLRISNAQMLSPKVWEKKAKGLQILALTGLFCKETLFSQLHFEGFNTDWNYYSDHSDEFDVQETFQPIFTSWSLYRLK